MIAKAEATRLLSAYIDAVAANDPANMLLTREAWDELATVAELFLRDSDLVVRGHENVEQKARRLLQEGRLTITAIRGSGTVVAECRGTETVHRLGYDAGRREWRCTCQARGRCSHLAALQLVTVRPT